MMNWDGDWGDHMDGAWGWLGGTMMVLWIVLLVLVIFGLVSWFLRGGRTTGSPGASDDARAILDRRFAAGEIDEETYRRMRDAISSDPAGDPQ